MNTEAIGRLRSYAGSVTERKLKHREQSNTSEAGPERRETEQTLPGQSGRRTAGGTVRAGLWTTCAKDNSDFC